MSRVVSAPQDLGSGSSASCAKCLFVHEIAGSWSLLDLVSCRINRLAFWFDTGMQFDPLLAKHVCKPDFAFSAIWEPQAPSGVDCKVGANHHNRPQQGCRRHRSPRLLSSYSITSLAIASRAGGTVTPSDLAVCRLMKNLNLDP